MTADNKDWTILSKESYALYDGFEKIADAYHGLRTAMWLAA